MERNKHKLEPKKKITKKRHNKGATPRSPPGLFSQTARDSFEDTSYCDGGELFPEAVGEVSLGLLASDVVQGVAKVALHLVSRVGGLEALHVLVDQGHQTRDVTPGDLFDRGGGGATHEQHNTRGDKAISCVQADFGLHTSSTTTSLVISPEETIGLDALPKYENGYNSTYSHHTSMCITVCVLSER